MDSKMRDPTGGVSKIARTARSTSHPSLGPALPLENTYLQIQQMIVKRLAFMGDFGSETFWALRLLAEMKWLLAFGVGQVFVA